MDDINERLREAAKAGSGAKLKALLIDPGCDALSKGVHGMTALMWAAYHGKKACVRLLLPASNAFAKDRTGMTALMLAAYGGHKACVEILFPVSEVLAASNNGTTASEWAGRRSHKGLAQFIDAYALSQTEKAAMGVMVIASTPRKKTAPRV